MARTIYFKGVPIPFDDAGFAGPWWHTEDDMKTCPCVDRSDVGVKPSGLVFCQDCGRILPMQPPKPKERP